MTNYEHIRNMSVSELAHFLNFSSLCEKCTYYHTNCISKDCDAGVSQWLLQEVKKND